VDQICSLVCQVDLASNINGVPLFSSSSYSLLPILCYMMNVSPLEVFVVALYGGTMRPAILNEAVNELNNSLLTGVQVGSVKYSSEESMPFLSIRCRFLYFDNLMSIILFSIDVDFFRRLLLFFFVCVKCIMFVFRHDTSFNL